MVEDGWLSWETRQIMGRIRQAGPYVIPWGGTFALKFDPCSPFVFPFVIGGEVTLLPLPSLEYIYLPSPISALLPHTCTVKHLQHRRRNYP